MGGGGLAKYITSFPGIDMVLTADNAFTLTESAIVAIDRLAYREAATEIPKIAAERKELAKTIEDNRSRTKELKAKIAELKKALSAKCVAENSALGAGLSELARHEQRLRNNDRDRPRRARRV